VQADPIKSKVKPPGTKRLKPKHDEPPSKFAFRFNLRCYTKGDIAEVMRMLSQVGRCRLTI